MGTNLSSKSKALLAATIAPVLWGLTWVGITEFMPADRPLLAACLRALPTGLVLLLIVRQLPKGRWWGRVILLGLLNFGIFFALLTVAAYRIPGGIGATMGALQPLLVLIVSIPLLAMLPRARELIASLVGVVGIGLLVLGPGVVLDMIGVIAAFGAVASMAIGIVLMQRWSDPDVGPLAMISWQLVVAGLALIPVSLFFEGAPPAFTSDTLIAVLFVGLLCTGVANWLWFIGLAGLPVAQASFMTLISPVVAMGVGWILLSESLTVLQMFGAAVALGSVVASQWNPGRRRRARLLAVQPLVAPTTKPVQAATAAHPTPPAAGSIQR